MKKNRLYFGMIIAFLVAIVVWTSYQMWNVGKEEEAHKVSVIVENSGLDRWSLLGQGLALSPGRSKMVQKASSYRWRPAGTQRTLRKLR